MKKMLFLAIPVAVFLCWKYQDDIWEWRHNGPLQRARYGYWKRGKRIHAPLNFDLEELVRRAEEDVPGAT